MKRELAAFGIFLAVSVAFTWPLALHLDSAAADRGDPLLTAAILEWVGHALLHAPLSLYDFPIYHPGRFALAYSENLIGIALLLLPLRMFGLSALAVQNLALIVGYAFSAYGVYVLARLVTRRVAPSILAGILFAFGSFMVSHVQHIQIVWSGWLPLLLAAVLAYWRAPGGRQAALLGAAFLMNGLTNVYWLMYGGVLLLVTVAFLALAEPRRGRRFWLPLAGALAIASVLLVPLLLPYQIVADEYGMRRSTSDSRGGSASLTNWLVPSSRNALYGSVPDPALHLDERELFPGILMLFLAAAAWRSRARVPTPEMAVRRTPLILDLAIATFAIFTLIATIQDRITAGRFSFSGADVPAMITLILLLARFFPEVRNRMRTSRFTLEEQAAALWILFGFVASLGWNAFLHPFLFRVLPMFRATRTPARWAVAADIGLAVWAAMGAVALLERTNRKRVVTALLLACAILELRPRIRWDLLDPHVAPVYRWLAREKPGVVLELPVLAHGVPYEYILATAIHRNPILNGASGFEPPLHELLRTKEDKLQYDDAFLDAAVRNGCAIVVVHESRLSPERRAAILPMLQRLEPLRRFGTDAVFRVPRAPADSASGPRESPRR